MRRGAGAQDRSVGVLLLIRLSRKGLRGVEAPFCEQGLLHLLWRGELEGAGLFRHGSALMSRLQLGHQLGDEPAGLLGVEVTHLLGHVH